MYSDSTWLPQMGNLYHWVNSAFCHPGARR